MTCRISMVNDVMSVASEAGWAGTSREACRLRDRWPPSRRGRVEDNKHPLGLVVLSLLPCGREEGEGGEEVHKVGPDGLAGRAVRLAPVGLGQGVHCLCLGLGPLRIETQCEGVARGRKQIECECSAEAGGQPVRVRAKGGGRGVRGDEGRGVGGLDPVLQAEGSDQECGLRELGEDAGGLEEHGDVRQGGAVWGSLPECGWRRELACPS